MGGRWCCWSEAAQSADGEFVLILPPAGSLFMRFCGGRRGLWPQLAAPACTQRRVPPPGMKLGECRSRRGMCECFARMFGVSWSPAASYVQDNSFLTRQPGTSLAPTTPIVAGAPPARSSVPLPSTAASKARVHLSICRGPARPAATSGYHRHRGGEGAASCSRDSPYPGGAELPPARPGPAKSGAHGLEGRPEPPPSCPQSPGPKSSAGAAQTTELCPVERSAARDVVRPGIAAEGRPPESHAFRRRHQTPLAESNGNAQAAQTLTGSPPPLTLGEAGDAADRAAQKEKLHAELKRVLQKKGERSQRSEEEEEEAAAAPSEMEAQLQAMEKTIETSELLEVIVETEAQTGVSGMMSVAGGGRGGLFVKEVLKDSPAAKALRLKEGDQLLSARVYFDDIKYEDALQILQSVEPCKVSFWLKRTVPGVDITRKPGTATFEVKGPKAKLAKLNIRSLRPLQKKKKKKKKVAKEPLREAQARGSGELELVPLDVEFSLPKFSRLRKAKSAGEVAEAEPSPDLSLRPSSLETKRRKLRFPRLKVKEVAAARAQGQLEVGRPKAAVGLKGEAEGKAPRVTVPFPKSKKPREPKADTGFQAPQVEVDLPMPKARPGAESPKAAARGEGFRLQAPAFGLPKVEAVVPKVSAVGPEGPEGVPQAGLRLPAAEVVAPKVDVDLSLPKWEGAAPEVSLKGEGFRIKVPTLGISAAEAEMKLPKVKSPALEVALGKGSRKAEEGLEEASTLRGAMPALEVEAPSLALELPLPKGKADAELPRPRLEIPDVSVKVPTIGLPKLGAARHEELESKLPQVELGVGKPESPKAKGPRIQGPGLGLSLVEGQGLESKAAGAAAGWRVPALDVSIPRAASVELAAPALPGAKAEVAAAEGPGFKLHMPQVALPKFDLAAKTAPLPPPAQHAREPKPEVDVGVTVDVSKLDLSLPAVKLPAVHLPKAHLPRPELDVAVERPAVEVAVPSPRLSFPSAAVPTLDMDLPRVGVELGLPKAEGRLVDSGHEVKLKMPTLETLGQELELSAPTCRLEQPGLEPSGGLLEGLEVSGVAANIPKVGLALGKEPAGAEGGEGKRLPTAGLEVDRSPKLPSVEISAAVTRPGTDAETEAKLKSPKFALPKFSLSGPKLRREGAEAEASETAGRGSKLRMPKFGISFPKSRWGVEAEGPGAEPGLGGRTAKGGAAADRGVSERGLKLPSVELSAGAPGLPEGKAEEEGGAGIGLPEVDLKVPKVPLPTFGDQGKEGEQELQAGGAKLRGSREGLAAEPQKAAPAKGAKFKMPSFSLTRRDGGEAPGLDAAGTKKPKGPSGKLSPPEAERGKLYLQAPGLPGRAPQVELPTFGTREAAAVVGTQSPGLQLKVPLLDIAVPGAKEGEEAVSEADRRGYEGELRVPSLGVSAPKVGLDVSLPAVGPEASRPPGTVGAEAKIRLPKVELPKFGKDEEGGSEAEVQLLGGHRPSLGREGRDEAEGGAEGALLGAKIRVPRVDLSLPKARLSEVELPLTAGEAVEGPEPGKFKLPSVGLPKFSAPKVKAPELEFDMSLEAGRGKVSGPAKLGDGEAEKELARGVPQLELKAPKLRGSPETLLGTDTGGREATSRVPSAAAASFGLGKAEAEATAGAEDSSKFKLKIPSLSLSKGGTESGMDTQPLCPAAEGAADFSFKMSQIALPDVGFSVEQGGKREARGGGGGAPAGLEIDLGGIEAVLKMPTFGGPKGDAGGTTPSQGRRGSGGGDLEGPKAAFRVPGVELSAPSLQAHAEYEVEGAQLRHGAPHQLEGADQRGSSGRKSPGGKTEEAGRKYRVKLPRFGLSMPRAGLEAGAGALGQQEAKGKGPIFGLAWPKGKGAEGSSGLLERDEEGGSKRGVMAKLKLGPSLGLSLSKPKTGAAVVNGELEGAATGGPSTLKVPELGFSMAEEAAAQHHEGASSSLQNGAQDGKTKLGKIRLPQVELSSPSTLSETDPELNLTLVRAEEAKEEAGGGRTGPFSSLKAPKFRAPKITFSGLKKRDGEAAPPGSTVGGSSVAVRTEAAAASLETGDGAAKGEKASRFRFPKLVLSPKSPHGTLEITSERHDGLWEGEGGLTIQLPSVGFSEELGTEKQILAAGGGPGRAVGKGEGEATAAV